MLDTSAARTPAESQFLAAVAQRMPFLDDWYHVDDQGRPWLLLSMDFGTDRAVEATLRLDFDGAGIQGGWSPACLNWEAGIDLSPPEGINVVSEDPALLADRAVEWFRWHRDRRRGNAGT